ncbi:MAG: glutathione peroxidase [Lactobacillus sp.]|jgi:glutathione peroxidase|nr:glutathione peroxidase [Lactobacillus sp.]MCI2032622.1 glutathione peroxidase [Lactobacillus sp.]
MMLYDYTTTLENGETYALSRYRGKPLVIVNTATKCGFAPQFTQLEALYQQYQAQGLMVLGFPSNQFKQELDSGSAAAEACRLTYGVSFPMHTLVKVNGPDADPLFQFLKHAAPGALGEAIKWNFCKFLVDRQGNVVERFAPKTNPEKMIPAIEKLL